MAADYYTSFSTLVPRSVYQTGVLTETQRIDLFRYFANVHDRWMGGEQFPYDLEELVPTVFSRKDNAVKKLVASYKKDEDYQELRQMEEFLINKEISLSPNPNVKYHLSCTCFEHMVAKRNKAIFAVYSQIFHATVEERKALLRPHTGEIRALILVAKELRMAESAKLAMLGKYFAQFPTTENILPSYVIDAPIIAGVSGDSAEATASAAQLLKERNSSYGAPTFLKLAEKAGFVEHLRRPSSKTPGVDREFWNVTEKGLEFGKNLINLHNPRSTQPHWYRSKFDALLNKLGANC